MKRYSSKMAAALAACVLVTIVATPLCLGAAGVVVKVDGKATIQTGDKSAPAVVGQKLQANDTVKSDGGTVSVLLGDGRMKVVSPGPTFIVPGDFAGNPAANRMINSLSEIVEKGKAPTVNASVRGAGNIKAISPFNSYVLPGAVTFQWEASSGLADLDVSVTGAKPDYSYSFRVKPDKGAVALPEAAPALQPGTKYYWQAKEVERAESEPYSTRINWFAVLPKESHDKLSAELKNIQEMKDTDAHEKAVLQASLFISYGLYNNAAQLLEKELQARPDDAVMTDLLCGVYVQMQAR